MLLLGNYSLNQLKANERGLETFTCTVSTGMDDVSENSAGQMTVDGEFLWLGGSTSGKLRAIRFQNVIIPENAVIHDAYIEFYSYGNSNAAGANVSVELGNPSTYSADARSISSRNYSTRKATWTRSGGLTPKRTVRTPNLNNVIDENRGKGWKSGQNLAFRFEGLNTNQGLSVYAYEGGSAYRPKLVIKYYTDQNFVFTDLSESIVSASNKDGSESSTGAMVLDGKFLWLGGSSSGNLRAICFDKVQIPATASIVDAYIEFFAYGDSPAATTNIYAQLGNASAYSASAYSISSRNYSERRVVWNRSASTSKELVRTSNLQSIIDENRSKGWVTGQNLAFKFEGLDINEGISVYSYDGGASYRPKLVIKYINDGKGAEPLPPPTNIACIGNSITYGYGLEFRNIHCYPAQLQKQLGVDYSVTNLGVNGASIQKTAEIPYWKTDNYAKAKTLNPDIFIVTLGANDSKAVNWKANSREQYKNDLKEMIKELKAAAIGKTPKFYVGIPSYVDPAALTSKETTISGAILRDEINPAAKEVATELGLEIIDFYNLTYGSSDLFFDKVHPNRNGAGVLAQYAADVIKNGPPIVKTVKSIVYAANDDGSESSTGDMTLNGQFLWLGGSQTGHLRCIRFNNIDIPENATIQNAYIEFYAYGNSEDSKTYIYSEIGNAQTYTTTAKSMSSRTYGERRIKWEADALLNKQKISTPTLKSLIDENRSKGWIPGQSMAFRFEGLSANEGTMVYAYEGGAAYRPKLVIEYIENEDQLVVDGAETDPQKMTLLRINEICSQGSKDQKGDWIELYNGHDFPLHIKGGIYLSDKNKNRTLAELKNIIIPAKGFYVFIADEEPEHGKDHLPFDLKNSGETVYLSRSQTDLIDQVTFGALPYNQSYGRTADGTGNFALFMDPTYGYSNRNGLKKTEISFSHERGIYPSGFNLSITAPQNMTIRYTTDGQYPSQTSGTIYTGAINISQTCVVKAIAYDNSNISEVVAHTYVLQSNLDKEAQQAADGSRKTWTYKSTIAPDEYAQALALLPIVSMSPGSEIAGVYKEASLEYIDNHLYDNSDNLYSNSMSRKFGNSTITDFNSGYKFKFTREANARKPSYPFFDPYENDNSTYPMPEKIHTLELKEGQDGASNTWAEAGYARFSEKITMNLQKEMGKFALETRFVHFFYNGKYKGIKTLRTDFKQQNMEEIFGDDSDNYTKISVKVPGKNDMITGVVESGDGIAAIWDEMKSYATAKNLQGFKKLVDLEDLIKFQIMFMFIDCEPEAEIIVHNNAGVDSKFMKAKFNINDTDGAYFANGSTAAQIPFKISYGAATTTYKWTVTKANAIAKEDKIYPERYRYGVGGFMEHFGGLSTKGQTGNLEFKTLVKDHVLDAFGPISGVGVGDAKYPLSIQNVQNKIRQAQAELDLAYKLDAAWYAPNNTRYNDWKNACTRIISQVPSRVNLSLSKWNEFGMAHTLQAATIDAGETVGSNQAITITDPNSGTKLYYTIDGSDPMGNDGAISPSAQLYTTGIKLALGAYKLVTRPFATNNWGPKTMQDITVLSGTGISLRNIGNDDTNNTGKSVNIYPNPVKDMLYIDVNDANNSSMTAIIYTIAGTEILRTELTSQINSISISDVPSGLYIVRILDKSNRNIQTLQIIKQ